MSNPSRCSKCQSDQLAWGVSRGRRRLVADILLCGRCNHREKLEDWTAPLYPLDEKSCANCGTLDAAVPCKRCGLSREEDEQVHQELRELIASESDFLSAARQANKIGRRLLALKLATAAVVYGPTARREPARAFRVWLLAAIGETKAAHDDATAWVQSHPSPTQLAWGSLGQQCETLKLFGEAIEAYGKALAVDSSQHLIRCRRAQLLLNQSRDGQALAELKMVFDGSPTGKAPDAILPICVNLLDRLETHNNLDSAATLLGWVGPQVQGSAPLLGHAARVNALAGREKEARKQLKKARSMTPDLPIYKRVEALLGEPSSWRKW